MCTGYLTEDSLAIIIILTTQYPHDNGPRHGESEMIMEYLTEDSLGMIEISMGILLSHSQASMHMT